MTRSRTNPDRRTARAMILPPPVPIDHDQRAATALAFTRQSARAAVALAEVRAGLFWSEADVRAARSGRVA